MFKVISFVAIVVLCFSAFHVSSFNAPVAVQTPKIATCHELALAVAQMEPSFKTISNIVDMQGASPVSEDMEGTVDLSCGGLVADQNGEGMVLLFYHAMTKDGQEEILVEGVEPEIATAKTVV